MAAANWSDAEVLRLIELWGEDSIQQQLEGAKRTKHVYEKLARELQKTGSDKTSVCKRNKSDGVVRDAITDQSTQHARKFVSRAVDTRAHAHRYYRILPTCGRTLNLSMNIVVQCKQEQNRSTERFQQAIQNRSMQV